MVDVTVMGAGIFGLSVAYACARRGARVRVVEPLRIGAGSSGGLVGALAPHMPEKWDAKKQFQFDSLIMAGEFWAGADQLSGLASGYGRIGRLQPIASERLLELSHQRAESARELWQGLARWQVVRCSDFGAWAPDSPTGYLVHDTLSARLEPRQAMASLAAAIAALGGEIVIGDALAQGQVVWASGYHGLRALSQELGAEIGGGVKGQSALLEYAAGDVPQLFADGLYVVPHCNGTVAVGSTSERDFTQADSTDQLLEDLLAKLWARFPVLAGAKVITRWAGVRPRGRKLAPILGAHPGRAGHFIANGGFKIGFGMAPKVGEMMADLLLNQDDSGIPDAFRVEANL